MGWLAGISVPQQFMLINFEHNNAEGDKKKKFLRFSVIYSSYNLNKLLKNKTGSSCAGKRQCSAQTITCPFTCYEEPHSVGSSHDNGFNV